MAPAPSFRLSGIEEAILVTQAGGAPWNCVFDLVGGRFDPGRLRSAWNTALARHELATSAVQPRDGGGWSWVPAAAPVDIGEVRIVDCRERADLDRLRSALVDQRIDVGAPPLVRIAIARGDDHDVLVCSISHVLADAIGMLRLLRSVVRADAGEHDPPPAVDLAAARRVLEPSAGTTAERVGEAVGALLGLAAERVGRWSRVAGSGGDGSGTGIVWRTVPSDRLAARRLGASFDAVVMAAVHVAIERWNAAVGDAAERIGVAQAWNLRPSEWWDDVVVNLASTSTVATTPADRVSIGRALDVVAPALLPGVRTGAARRLAGAAALGRSVPPALRSRLLAVTPEDSFDSFAVSNFGVIGGLPGIRAAGMTPEEMGIGLALYTVGAETHLAFRFRRERFDDAGAGGFADEVVATLLDG